MDTRLTTYGIWRLLIAASVALALVMTLGATSTTAASPTACRVQNTHTRTTFTAFQAAVDAASKGDRLTVRGTCHGGAVIDTDLVIKGVQTSATDMAVLDGDGKGRVLKVIRGVRVSLRDLTVRGGNALRREGRPHNCTSDFPSCGGGIINRGTLILWSVLVLDNHASDLGGGVTNQGTLTLNGHSRISGNTAHMTGGGVENQGTLTLNGHSRISHNTGRDTSATGVYNTGSLTLNDHSRISGNRGSSGAGVENFGRLTLNDHSRISGNTASHGVGGGVSTYGGTLTLNHHSQISGNTSRGIGGGRGGGVYSYRGTLTLNDRSRISGNTARGEGGGVYAQGGKVRLRDHSRIDGNTVLTRRGSGTGGPAGRGGVGGGVYHATRSIYGEAGAVVLKGASSITGNSAEVNGGGIAFFGEDAALNVLTCAPNDGANVLGNAPDDCLAMAP